MADPYPEAVALAAAAQIQTLGKRLRNARIGQNLTQTALAARVGLSRGAVMRLEHGDPTVSLGAAARISQALYATDLLGGGSAPLGSLTTRRRVREKSGPTSP